MLQLMDKGWGWLCRLAEIERRLSGRESKTLSPFSFVVQGKPF